MKNAVVALVLLSPLFAWGQGPHQEEFQALDLNGDGKVSLAEAAGYANVVVRFDKADRNRDGKLTMAEFNRLKKLKIRVNEKAAATRSAGVGASGRR